MIGPLLGAIVLIAVVVFYNRRRNRYIGANTEPKPIKRNCQWVATGDPERRLREYRCRTCGVTGYSSTGSPPIECKQGLK